MTRERRLALFSAAAAAAVVAVVALAVASCGERAPATGAARVVPSAALAYVHVSTDREREPVRQAGELLERFPTVRGGLDSFIARLTSIGPGLSYRRDVRPWLGREAALALLDTGTRTAVPLAVIAVADRGKAEAFLGRASTPPEATAYGGGRILTYGGLSTAFVGGYLVVGPEVGVRAAIDARAGRVPALAGGRRFRRATAGLPDDRAADVYLSARGVQRLLLAQRGVLGGVGALLIQPGLEGVSIGLIPDSGLVRLWVHSVLGGQRRPPTAFEPRLAEEVPEGALAYLGRADLGRSGPRLLRGLAGTAAPSVAALLNRAAAEARRSGVDLRRALLPLVRGEVAVWLRTARPDPILTLIAATRDERRTSEALAALRRPLVTVLAPPRGADGPAPRFRSADVEGARAYVLKVGPRAEIAYAVFDGKLVVSTALAGIRAVRDRSGSLPDATSFEVTLGDHPSRVTSLVFLDFGQLLAFGERSGLSANPAYQAIGADLRKVRALGAAGTAGRTDSTTDITLEIK
jgi:Protein of unknown function (DUF3352)